MAARKRRQPRRAASKPAEPARNGPDATPDDAQDELQQPAPPSLPDADRSAEEIAERDHPLV